AGSSTCSLCSGGTVIIVFAGERCASLKPAQRLRPDFVGDKEAAMFTSRMRLFRLLGIPIYADASWLIIVALLTWSLATGVFPEIHRGFTAAEYWAMAFISALLFFVCIVLHELGHAVVARARGIPIRGITLFLFGGVAEMTAEPPSASSE